MMLDSLTFSSPIAIDKVANMWAYIQSLFRSQQEQVPTPTPVTIMAARFPADGKSPHLVPLRTTSQSNHRFSFDGHVPDMREYWDIPDPWRYADKVRFEVTEQLNPICDGIYIIFFTFAIDDLQENPNFPQEILNDRFLYGDVFVVKLQAQEYGEYGWAVYDDVPTEFLDLPQLRGKRTLRSDIKYFYH